MRLLKDSRTARFTLDNADEELQAVVLLMALPDEGQFAVLKAPFEQSPDDLRVSSIEQAYANHQAFRTAHQEGDTSQINPLSGLAMAVTSPAHLLLLQLHLPLRNSVRVVAKQTTRSSNATSSWSSLENHIQKVWEQSPKLRLMQVFSLTLLHHLLMTDGIQTQGPLRT
jgi:hypothetical protein